MVLKQKNQTNFFLPRFSDFVLKLNNERRNQTQIILCFLSPFEYFPHFNGSIHCLRLPSSHTLKPLNGSLVFIWLFWLLAYTDCQSAFVFKRTNLLVSVQSFLIITTGTKINHWTGLRCSASISSPSQRKSISRNALFHQCFHTTLVLFFISFSIQITFQH